MKKHTKLITLAIGVLALNSAIAENKQLTPQNNRSQVSFNVQILSMETKAKNNYKVNWSGVTKNKDISLKMYAESNNQRISNNDSNVFILKADKTSSSNSVIKTIETLIKDNNIKGTYTASNITLNNESTTIAFMEQLAYVASSSTLKSLDGTKQEISTNIIDYGFSLNLLPKIIDNHSLDLTTVLTTSSIIKLNKESTPDGIVQLPELIQRNIQQQINLQDGDTLIFNNVNYNPANSDKQLQSGPQYKIVVFITPKIDKTPQNQASNNKSVDPQKFLNYEISGETTTTFNPVSVFDDGTHVYIQLPKSLNELPSVYGFEADGKTLAPVNFKYVAPYYIVDGLFKKGALILGSGSNSQKIVFTRIGS